jgi:excinuclease ABC subunit C
MRDDKQYFFVAVTNEDFPQFILTHQAKSSRIKKPIRELIGPFTDGAPLKATLRALRRLFPYCSCKQQHHVRCLNAHIGKCPGYCCLHPVRERPAKGVASATSGRLFSNGVKSPAPTEQKKEYQRSIRAITDILTGKRDTLVRHLEKEMKAAGTAHQFERALELQRTIERIRRVFENAQINASRQHNAAQHHGALEQLQIEFGLADLPHRIEGYDIANIHGQHATGSMIVFTDGRADPSEYRKFNIKTVRGSNDTAMLREVISRRFTHPEWQFPDVILVDGGKGQLNAIRTALGGLAIPVIALTKNSRHQGDHVFSSLDTHVRYISDLSRPLRDLILHIDSEAHRFAISHYRRRHSKSLVK